MLKYFYFLFSIIVFVCLFYLIINFDVKNDLCSYAYVQTVQDGDTVTTKELWKIRLLWIDTPEFYYESLWIQDHKFYGCAEKSKQLAQNYLEFKDILFCRDVLADEEDIYWRKLRYAIIWTWDDTLNFWKFLLLSWYTQVYKYAPFTYSQEYKELEKNNKEQKIWVWSKECLIEDQLVRQEYWTWCNIKWNISSKWEKIYYLPKDSNYSRVKISKEWEKFYCDYKLAEQDWFIRIQEK
jgi:endonuclease YncB( thermonuclease family)